MQLLMGKPKPKLGKDVLEMRQRSIKKQLWLNQNEDKILKVKASKAGLSEAEFLRSIIKGYRIKEQPNEIILKFMRQLYGIANNINQIARDTNSFGMVRPEDYEYIKEEISNFILNFEKEIYTRKR